ncbi:hypothetical protein QEN19_001854 [Hanseniaspora menglaensis]
MNFYVEKVQFESDDESLSFLTQNKIDITKKQLKVLRVFQDVMYLVYSLSSTSGQFFVIQKIALNEPDVVITMKLVSGKHPSVNDYFINEVIDIYKLYNETEPSRSEILIKTLSGQTNGPKYHYFFINNDVLVPSPQLSKRNIDITTTSNCFENSILFGTSNGKVYHYNILTSSIVKLNQYSAPVQGVHYAHNVLTVIVGVTVMKYKDITEILNFSVDLIPNEIENYSTEIVNKNDDSEPNDLEHVKVFDNLSNGSYVINYIDELVVNNYTHSISEGTVLLKKNFLNNNSDIVACCLSEYHLIYITNDNKISIINQLNIEKKVVNQLEDVEGQLLGLDVDFCKQNGSNHITYWIYDDSNNVFEIIIENEYKDVIDDLVNLNRYRDVLSFKLEDADLIQSIYNKYFQYLIAIDDCDIDELISVSGQIYANFTSVITSVMGKLKKNCNNDTLIIKLVNLLQNRVLNVQMHLTENQTRIYFSLMLHLLTQLTVALENDKIIREFLLKNQGLLDFQLTKNFLARSPQNLVFYFKLIKDYKSLIKYQLSKNNNFLEAIKTISVYCNDPNVVYETADVLLMNCPEETVKTWAKLLVNNIVDLDLKLLFSSLLKYFHTNYQEDINIKKKNHALWFLSWYHATYDSSNKSINNYIVFMLFLDEKNYDIDRLLGFINDNWENIDQFLLLNLVQRNNKVNKIEVTIYILNKLQMYEEALKLCLKEEMFDSARDVINSIDDFSFLADTNKNPNTKALKKKLWLLIANDTITNSYNNNKNLKTVISDLLSESENILSIIDIFPIINKLNVTVAVIKEDFIAHLTKENKLLAETSKEIENLIHLKQKILKDIDYLTVNYHQEIKDDDVCDYCSDNLILKKKFYCFPCCHKLHVNCVLDMILNGGDFTLKNKIETIMYKKESKWLEQINNLLGKKCPICTDISINNIDEPFSLEVNDSKIASISSSNGSIGNIVIDYLKL